MKHRSIRRLALSFLAVSGIATANTNWWLYCEKPGCQTCESSEGAPQSGAFGVSISLSVDNPSGNASLDTPECQLILEIPLAIPPYPTGGGSGGTGGGGAGGGGTGSSGPTTCGVGPNNYTSSCLAVSGGNPNSVATSCPPGGTRQPTQCQTSTSCLVFQDNNDGSGFTCTCYPRSQVSAPDSSGICTIPSTARPSSCLTFTNPDHGAVDDSGTAIPSKGNLDVSYKQIHPKTGEWVTRTTRIHAPKDDLNWTQKSYFGDLAANPSLQSYREVQIDRTPVEIPSAVNGDQLTHEITRERDSANNLVVKSDVQAKYAFYKLGKPVKLSETKHTGTGSDLTTTYTYYTDPSKPVSFNKPATMRRSDGQWANYSYEGSLVTGVISTKTVTGWLDNPAPAVGTAPDESANRVVTQIEAKNETGTFGREEKIQGVTVAKSWGERSKTENGDIVEKSNVQMGSSVQTLTRTGYASDTSVPVAARGRIKSVSKPDGTVELHSYKTSGSNRIETVDLGAGDLTAVVDGTRLTNTYNSSDVLIGKSSSDIRTGIPMASRTAIGFDARGNPSQRAYDNNPDDTSATQNGCCAVDQTTDRDGVVTDYTHDALKRTTSSASNGVTDHYTYGSSNVGPAVCPAVHHTQSGGTGGGALIVDQGTAVSDLAGNTIQEIQPDSDGDGNPEVTSTVIDYTARTRTTTAPDGSSYSTATYADGQIKSTTGSGQVDTVRTHSFGADLDGISGAVHKTTVTSGSLVTETYLGMGGQTLVTKTSGTITATYGYDNRGRMILIKDGDGVTTLYAYNAKGERYRSAVDRNNNGVIDLGIDTVTDSVHETVANVPGFGPAIRTSDLVWISATESRTLSSTLQSPDGTLVRQESLGVANPSSVSNTPHINRRTGSWTDTETYPDGTGKSTTYLNWLPVNVSVLDAANHVIESVTTGYDALRRPVTSTHSRTGLVTTIYAANGRVSSINDHGRITSFGYDAMGRRISTNLPDNSVIHTSYWPSGREKGSWGSQTNPTVKLYSLQGQLVELRTFRSGNLALAPDENTVGYDATIWTYNSLGQVTRKQYADGKGTDYAYTAAGRLHTRTWARGAVTTYGYDNSGRHISTDYSDTTPDVSITYDSLGRRLSSSTLSTDHSALITSSSFSYDPSTLASVSETISYDLNADGTPELIRVIDRTRDTLGRSTGYTLGSIPDPDAPSGAIPPPPESRVSYAYGPTDGRISSISDLQSPNISFSYSYLPNSNLISSIAATSGAIHDVLNSWASDRDVLLGKQNRVGSSVVSQYDYTVNAIEQRTNVSQTGSAFQAARAIAFAYDALGEVISADSTNNPDDRAYQYDAIGNRRRAAAGTLEVIDSFATVYSANALNLYSSINDPQSTIHNPTHDDDGNQLSGPVQSVGSSSPASGLFTWDAENRLTSATVNTTTTTYLYDAQSRRIATTAGGSATLYLYNGWNCIAEYSSISNSQYLISKTYLWGIDISGSFHGAGGVSGLLSETINNQPTTISFFPTYDGNGNISEYLTATGIVAAHFEYDPFGNTVVNTDATNQFAYRFSSKPVDFASGLCYYGYRWYNPLTGGWLARDPVGETGGLNLFGILGNDCINWVDVLGLSNIDLMLTDPLGFYGNAYSCFGSCSFYGGLGDGLWNGGADLLGGVWFGIKQAARHHPLNYRLWTGDVASEDWESAKKAAQGFKKLAQIAQDKGAMATIQQISPNLFSLLNDPPGSDAFCKSMGNLDGQVLFQVLLALATEGAGNLVAELRAANASEEAIELATKIETAAANTEAELVNLASSQRTTHILTGDATGGGHMWPGLPDKTPFPQGWSGDKIMNYVSDIATDPSLQWVQQTGKAGSFFTKAGDPARFFVIGEREGVQIKVVLEPAGEGIITSHPLH